MATNLDIDDRLLSEAQKIGGVAAYVDAEHAMDPLYAGRVGVDLDDLLISQPDTGEQALIVDLFGTVEFDPSYDHKKQRKRA